MKINSKRKKILHIFVYSLMVYATRAQDYEGADSHKEAAAPPPAEDSCNGIFLSYTFIERKKEFPHIKNASAQPWAFKSTATILNAGMLELKNWEIFIGFQHKELLVSASNAVLVNGEEFPAHVGNGTYIAGYPQTDLKTSIDTAGDLTQIRAIVELSGTQFGIKPPGYPMPKVIKLVNNGYRCPNPKRKARTVHVCCVKDSKLKMKNTTTKHYPRQKGDLEISYDVLQAYANNYQAQVLIENKHPLGRLDHWNLTWEWSRGEFIYNMRGAYTHRRDYSKCIYGSAGQYYKDFDFSNVMNCEKNPVIADLPPDRAKDKEIGNIPFCCRNGTLLPITMNETKSVAVFQLQVFKLPPDLNRTALYPPGKWRIEGEINPQYKCGPALRVDETEFPNYNGLQVTSTAIASWQVVCNITKPKMRENKCCVSYSAYYNDSVIPCNTCACGCGDSEEKWEKCNQNSPPLFLPSEALLLPFENRTLKAVYWAKLMHYHVPKTLPCGDNCGVSLNWHIATNYRTGWTARITLFNWKETAFPDWFVAVQFNKSRSRFLRAYSFNATLLSDPNDTIFLQGLPYMNYLIAESNGTDPDEDPRVPGKQQSVLQFKKKKMGLVHIQKGYGFPTKLVFNGEECALPTIFPQPNGSKSNGGEVGVALIIALLTLLLLRIPH